MKFFAVVLILIFCLGLLAACSETGYLLQSVAGHLNIMRRAEPIDEMLARGDLSPELHDQLSRAVALRKFANEQLHLPDNGSYRQYADLERPFAVWNVVAAPEFSLELKNWCFPFAGCVSYRGYFEESKARAMADKLNKQGYDTELYGVQAYSTLNWFKDPVLNTFLAGDELRLAALLFHELAHQVVYVPGETVFNESFAKTVEMEGLRLWLRSRGEDGQWERYQVYSARHAELQQMILEVCENLKRLYAKPMQADELRRLKGEALEDMGLRYKRLKESWGGYTGFDLWMSREWNNARLGSMLTYEDLVPVFRAILQEKSNDLSAFYAEVKSLAALSGPERLARLNTYRQSRQAALPPDIPPGQ